MPICGKLSYDDYLTEEEYKHLSNQTVKMRDLINAQLNQIEKLNNLDIEVGS